MDDLQVGGVHVDRQAVREHARCYLTERHGWAYPSYDGYDAAHATGPLVDADLLAPLLLNVTRISITTYEALQVVRPQLQKILDRIPIDASLVDAGHSERDQIGELFGVLDGKGISGARGTVLSKLLHRKRPAFIPMYDRQVGRVYQDKTGAAAGRSWQEFAVLFAAVVQEDLQREWPFWQEIAAFAENPTVTPLRALDIVAWQAGAETKPVG